MMHVDYVALYTCTVNGTDKSLNWITVSRPDLREPVYLSIWLDQGVIWVGILVFYFFVGRVWFPIRGSCLSLSLIGNQSYLGSLFSTWVCGILFMHSCCRALQNFTFVRILLFCRCFSINVSWTLSTLRFGLTQSTDVTHGGCTVTSYTCYTSQRHVEFDWHTVAVQ